MDHSYKCKNYSKELLQENIEKYLCDLEIDKRVHRTNKQTKTINHKRKKKNVEDYQDLRISALQDTIKE
jgi:hypothetical protein